MSKKQTFLDNFIILPIDIIAIGIWFGFTALFAGLGFDSKLIWRYILGVPIGAIIARGLS